ncbi:MAG: PD40 domain-containing protein [Bryobacterales bacterium]|nr:PD40 domain-containing protein [Bryobacterales bacterium]
MKTDSPSDSSTTNAGPASAHPPLLRFGSFEVDTVSGELRKHGIRLHLPGQPFQILAILLDRTGEAVTREELQRSLWPQDLPADSDRSLNTAVNRLRCVLGDVAGSARYIETLPRKGYRFVSPVERIARRVEAPLPPVSALQPAVRWRPPSWPILGIYSFIGIGILALAAAFVWRIWNNADAPLPSRVAALTQFPGTETTPSLSPDGRQAAFSWNGGSEAKLDIHVRAIGSSALRRVTNTIGNAFSPSYSPDGRRIAFYRRAGDSAYVHIVSAESQNLVRAAGFGLNVGPPLQFPAHSPMAPSPDLAALSWSPDGSELAYIDKSSPGEPYSIFLSPVSDWRGERFTAPPSGIRGDGSPAFSPDGRRLAFVRSLDDAAGDLYVASLNDGALQRLTRDGRRIAGIAWAEDGKSIVFSTERSGLPALWRIDVATSALEPVRQVREAAALPSISRAGNTLAYVRWSGREDLVRIPLNIAVGAAVDPATVTRLFENSSNPEYSPDGSKVVFSMAVGNANEIWVSDADGRDAVRLTTADGYAASPRWSPDGRFIAFDARAANNFGIYDVFVISATGGTPRRLTSGPLQNTRPAWSSDGRFIYFASDRSGTQQIWKVPAEGGSARQITHNGGSEAIESPGGETLYYSRRSVPGLWSIPSGGGKESLVIKDLQWENSRNWTVTRDGIYYLLREGDHPSNWGFWLMRHDFKSGASRKFAQLGNLPILNGRCTLSPTKQSILSVQERRAETDLAALAGFQ